MPKRKSNKKSVMERALQEGATSKQATEKAGYKTSSPAYKNPFDKMKADWEENPGTIETVTNLRETALQRLGMYMDNPDTALAAIDIFLKHFSKLPSRGEVSDPFDGEDSLRKAIDESKFR